MVVVNRSYSPHEREDLGRGRDREAGEPGPRQRLHPLLVDRVRVGVEEADRERLDVVAVDRLVEDALDLRDVERLEHLAVVAEPLGQLAPEAAGHQRRRVHRAQVEEVVAGLAPEVE